MKLFTSIISSRAFLLILLLGLILRIATMFYSFQFRENTDVLRYKDWGRIAFLYNLEETYRNTHLEFGTLANNQPPGSLYVISSTYYAQIQVAKLFLKIFNIEEGAVAWMNVQLPYAFLRLPSLLADLIIGALIYTIVRSKTTMKNALFSCSLFIFNPVILYNSAFWGQMDSINNMLLLIALFLLMKKSYFFSIFFFLLSFYVKLSLIFFLPVILIIYYLLMKNKLQLLFYFAGSILAMLYITLPISNQPHTWLFEFITKNGLGEIQSITAFAFNFWWMMFNPVIRLGSPDNLFTFSQVRMINSPSSSSLFFGISLMHWSLIIFSILLIPIIRNVIKLKNRIMKNGNLFLICSLVVLISFLFLPQMHERYMYPLFPLLSIYIGIKRKLIWILITLSLLNFINLYIVWHPMKILLMPYELMGSQLFQWLVSLLIVSTGVVFYLKSIKTLYAEKN